MAVVTLNYDASTGSDTLASGAGPSTAVTGTATAGAGNIVNLSGSPDLSGVAVDDVLWVASASGNRHLSRITAVDDGADTVTTEDTLTLGAGVNFAIGGSRKTLEYDNTANDINDGKAGWRFSLGAGTYTMVGNGTHIFTPAAGTLADGPIEFVAASGAATKPVISWSNDFRLFNLATVQSNLTISGIALENTASASSGAVCVYSAVDDVTYRVVTCDLLSYGRCIDANKVTRLTVVGSDIESTNNAGIRVAAGTKGVVSNCWIHDCGRSGSVPNSGLAALWDNSSTSGSGVSFIGNRVTDSAGYGMFSTSTGTEHLAQISNNVIYGSAIDGIAILGNARTSLVCFVNNIVSNNIGYGVNFLSGTNPSSLTTYADFNAFWQNTSGHRNNISAGANDVTLTADPFVDAAAGDFTLNSTAGGGAACEDAGLGYNG